MCNRYLGLVLFDFFVHRFYVLIGQYCQVDLYNLLQVSFQLFLLFSLPTFSQTLIICVYIYIKPHIYHICVCIHMFDRTPHTSQALC